MEQLPSETRQGLEVAYDVGGGSILAVLGREIEVKPRRCRLVVDGGRARQQVGQVVSMLADTYEKQREEGVYEGSTTVGPRVEEAR
jgi:hypothetical protein